MKTSKKSSVRLAVAGGLVVAAVLTGTAVAQTGTGRPDQGADPAFPTFVHLPADQAAHPDTQNEWWYVVGHVTSHGHRFGYEVQIIRDTNHDGTTMVKPQAEIAITDETTGKYYTVSPEFTASQASFSTTSLDARTPSASLSGPRNAMRLHAELPVGSIDLTLNAKGPVMYPNGTGLMPFLGGSSYYYSLPDVATTGTIVENGRTYQVSGKSWMDQQYGNWNWANTQKWTWQSIQLSNGDNLNLWDIFSSGTEDSYATVQHPNGSEEVVAVDPLSSGASGFTTSPTTGQRFATKWNVSIPGQAARLTVTADSPKLQEIQDAGGIFEGAGSVTGTYNGSPVTGQAYVEQLGNWHPTGTGSSGR